MVGVNETHDPAVRSWVDTANAATSDFPIQNLPFGVARVGRDAPHVMVAIGDAALDLHQAARAGLLDRCVPRVIDACTADSLNALMAWPPDALSPLRRAIHDALREDAPRPTREVAVACLHPQAAMELLLPAAIGDFTDFYASIDHATNVGRLFRPQNPLPPNYRYMPIAYHGRASSIVVTGTAIRRPQGQQKPEEEGGAPVFGPSARLDYELEVGMFIGPGNPLGSSIAVADAGSHLFGICLLNDWSARDIQAWESQPLGPFLSKNFATTISPWVVTIEALEPYRAPVRSRDNGDPAPLPHLWSDADQQRGAFDVTVEVFLSTERLRDAQALPVRLSEGSVATMYWSPAQMIAHHTSNGCNLRPGDLLGTGTVSGRHPGSRGCLLELTSGGREPLRLPNGEERTFLEDGDEVIIRGSCRAEGRARIGLGECRGRIERSR